MIAEPRCSTRACRHLVGVYQPHDDESVELPCCTAFAHGIPDEISYGGNDHTAPYPGDHGIQYEAESTTKAKAKPTRRLAPIPFDTPKNHRAIATYTRVLSNAFHTLGRSVADQLRARAVGKSFNPDQPRDEHGRWEGGGGGLNTAPTDSDRARWSAQLSAQAESATEAPEGKYSESDAISHISAAVDLERNAKLSQRANLRTAFAEQNGKLVAAGAMTRDRAAGTATIEHVGSIAPGAGAAVMEHLLGQARSWGVKSVHLETTVPKYYERFGFKSTGESEDGTAMRLNLSARKADFGKVDKTPEEQLAEAQAIVDALDLSTLEVIVEELTNAGIDVATDAGILAISQFGMESNSNLVDHVNSRAVDWAKDRAAELVGMRYDSAGNLVPSANAAMRIDESTRDMVRDSIAAGLQNGDRITEIADDLTDLYAFSDERAALIANTEVRRAQSQGALDGYKETQKLGVEMYKIWLVADEPCEICEPNGEQGAIPIDDDFDSGDDAPPAHPNCRCVIAPVVDENAFDSETDDFEGEEL